MQQTAFVQILNDFPAKLKKAEETMSFCDYFKNMCLRYNDVGHGHVVIE